MSTPHLELDFLGLHHHNNNKDDSPSLQPRPILDRRRSFCGISKINPEIVKNVIAASLPSTPNLPLFKPLPSFTGASATANHDTSSETAPFTIIYQGTVSVFDLPKNKAENIINFAMEQGSSKNEGVVVDDSSFNARNENNIFGELNDGDLPIKRKKSLQRFFEKRKERLISVSPYPIQHMVQLYQKKT